MSGKKEDERPKHSVEPSKSVDAQRKRGDHEVEAPKARTDDEVGSDEGVTNRQE